jgi:hypothetical protein
MTNISATNPLRELFLDLKLLALTSSLPNTPKACEELAIIEHYLNKLNALGLDFSKAD